MVQQLSKFVGLHIIRYMFFYSAVSNPLYRSERCTLLSSPLNVHWLIHYNSFDIRHIYITFLSNAVVTHIELNSLM